ncbi:hypothetical protein CONPUDRAFT_154701 [Coniophora puteana RWD-64-598 SS2]|uniref:DUF6589 domain-containing protein n=1 Tax=Coniophora puteana (strain RWD-64-598) TaxID=741705 RepID=A0A5M3MNF9_CONPW|nr:uncharacterized protein CONPUDRAFT_154701 [Coniophora puteana RWD-64-598 SS2]EIW80689.1 hypothetical protein CONPUDRAFT_154701 [Coniophora puteana RWD-64-598 SS2]
MSQPGQKTARARSYTFSIHQYTPKDAPQTPLAPTPAPEPSPAPSSPLQWRTHSTPDLGGLSARKLRAAQKEAEIQAEFEGIITRIANSKENLGAFLERLFRASPGRSHTHQTLINGYLTGNTRNHITDVLDLILSHPDGRPNKKHPEYEQAFDFTRNGGPRSFRLAQPATLSWAAHIIGEEMNKEGKRLTSFDTNPDMHFRVTSGATRTGESLLEGTRARESAGRWESAGTGENGRVYTAVDAGTGHECTQEGTELRGNGRAGESERTRENARAGESKQVEMVVDADPEHELIGEGTHTRKTDRVCEGVDVREYEGVLAGVDARQRELEGGQDEPSGGATQQRRTRGPGRAPVISWATLKESSINTMKATYHRISPLTLGLLTNYMTSGKSYVEGDARPEGQEESQVYRSKDTIGVSTLSEMTFARNQGTNLFAIAKGVVNFGTSAHQAVHRIGSKLAHSISFSSILGALRGLGYEKAAFLRSRGQPGVSEQYQVVLDNVQTYVPAYDPDLSNAKGKMHTGTAATAIRMEDCEPDAFDLAPVLERMREGRREEADIDTIVHDIDFAHIFRVFQYHCVKLLVDHVTILRTKYHDNVNELFSKNATRHQINPNRVSEIHPLATNSADEVSTRGMKAALDDFLEQMGNTAANFRGKWARYTGDGKSFEAMLKIQKYLSGTTSVHQSMEFILPGLQLWHTRWHNLSSNVRCFWGWGYDKSDPSCLAFLARSLGRAPPGPTKLKTVHFYQGRSLMDTAIHAHVLQAWEVVLDTKDLSAHFSSLGNSNEHHLPTLDDLLELSRILVLRYATYEAYECAREGNWDHVDDQNRVPPVIGDSKVPPQQREVSGSESESESDSSEDSYGEGEVIGVRMRDDLQEAETRGVTPGPLNGAGELTDDSCSSAGEEVPGDDEDLENVDTIHVADTDAEPVNNGVDAVDEAVPAVPDVRGDQALANGNLMMYAGLLWLEVSAATKSGDIGRIYEVFKIWILTFSGGGNPNYANYLTEEWCRFKYEYPQKCADTLLNNALVRLSESSPFVEIDLLQEWFNGHLEELAQHKGKEFDDEYYRFVLAMNVFDFLRLTKDMEGEVGLEPRTTHHTKRSRDAQLRRAMDLYRDYDLHRYKADRYFGFEAPDYFAKGYAALSGQGRIQKYIKRSLVGKRNLTTVAGPPSPSLEPPAWLEATAEYADEVVTLEGIDEAVALIQLI